MDEIEVMMINRMRGVRERLARLAGVPEKCVHIEHHLYSSEDGGPAWTVSVSQPAPKRGRAESVDGFASVLADAEADAARKVALHWGTR